MYPHTTKEKANQRKYYFIVHNTNPIKIYLSFYTSNITCWF